jgi:hypothetical protein
MPVPIHAAVMLGHALGERLGKPVRGVALVLHDARIEEEWLPKVDGKGERLLANKRGATAFYVDKPTGGGYASTSQTPAAMSYQMHATANGCFSLVLDFGDAHVTSQDVQAQLRTMRFAGGTLQNNPRILIAHTEPDVLRQISSGYLVMDASARAAQALSQGQEPAHVFLHKHPNSYVVPAVVGYQLLTAISDQRKGIRQTPGIEIEGHAFAESILGLIEFRHVNRFKYPALPPESDAEEDGQTEDHAEPLNWDSLEFDDAEPPDEQEADEAPDTQPTSGTSIFWQHGWCNDGTSFLIQQQ